LITHAVDPRGALRARPRVLTRGVVWEDAERDLLEEVCSEAELAVNKLQLPSEDDALRDAACRATRRVFRDEVGFRPLTHCVVLRATE
jgi:hypothetical protein